MKILTVILLPILCISANAESLKFCLDNEALSHINITSVQIEPNYSKANKSIKVKLDGNCINIDDLYNSASTEIANAAQNFLATQYQPQAVEWNISNMTANPGTTSLKDPPSELKTYFTIDVSANSSGINGTCNQLMFGVDRHNVFWGFGNMNNPNKQYNNEYIVQCANGSQFYVYATSNTQFTPAPAF
jgi:hypothetical protein